MVLGLGLKKKGATAKVEFQIQVQEIKPWRENIMASRENVPLLMQWHRGDNRSGRTRSAMPKFEDGGKIVFNHSFQLPAKLVREPTTRTGQSVVGTKFKKKTITFILLEETTDLQLARCVMDLAEYGDLQSSVLVSIPLAVGNKNASAGPTPSLFLTIGPLRKEERSFGSRMSFKSLTPRGSFLKASEKVVNVDSKLGVKHTIDEDTRRSIMVALMSNDDDDNLSIESFTDDESTPETSTPKSAYKVPEASTSLESEMLRATTSTTPSKLLEVVDHKTHLESPTNNTTHARPMLTKHDRGKTMHTSPTIVATINESIDRSSHIPTRLSLGKANKILAISSAEETLGSSTTVLAATIPTTQTFVVGPIFDSKIVDEFSIESTTNTTKIHQSILDSPPKIESQLSNVTLQPPFIEREKAALSTLATNAIKSHSSTSNNSSKSNKISTSSLENRQLVAHTLTDKVINNNLSIETKKPNENFGTKHVHLSTHETVANKGLSQETPSSESSMIAKHGESKDMNSDVGSNILMEVEKKWDENKAIHNNSLDVKKDIIGEEEGKKKVPEKHEEVVEYNESVLGSARANLAKIEKRALEELRMKIANIEAKYSTESQKVENLQGELRDVSAMEVSLYCVVAEHDNLSHKFYTPARRLARLYIHAQKNWTLERRASTIKNSMSGLVIVAKSCGSDISRLTFWWSNVVALRAIVTITFNKELPSESGEDKAPFGPVPKVHDDNGSWAKKSSFAKRSSLQTFPAAPKPLIDDKQEANTYIVALEKLEEWIYVKIVESLWSQAMIPPMQKDIGTNTSTNPKGIATTSPSTLFDSTKEDLSKVVGDLVGISVKKQSKHSSSLPKLGDARQGNFCVEVWKTTIVEALRRLCPRRGARHDCSCLPMLIKMAIDGCVARLDVALFNAILREPGDDVRGDPSDLVIDSSVLPISPGGLTFGGGSQLKNAVVTWSTFIAGLVTFKEPIFVLDAENIDSKNTSKHFKKIPRVFNLIKATGDLLLLPKDNLMDANIRKDETRPVVEKSEHEKSPDLFVLLRTTGDILQLPKDLIMDKSLRREICPMLSIQLIRRILVNFVPDEFSPEPISPSLLAALNAEAEIEKQRHGEVNNISTSTTLAIAPPIIYVAPSPKYVWSWLGEGSVDTSVLGCENSSLLRKGYTSDEDLAIMEKLQRSSASSKLELLMGNSLQETINGEQCKGAFLRRSPSRKEIGVGNRFELLKEVWGTQ